MDTAKRILNLVFGIGLIICMIAFCIFYMKVMIYVFTGEPVVHEC